ncbi:hypothetical protein Bca52824_011334 [Brassica carinata]|uniref:Uncharacterized protein n=1 Tax=Brassica carinata TaxID=52824 RepID=A0A8X7WEH7_BRACI|nr:hypothetical protein Bca52824_011334 [Brassica carinata]
MEDFLELEEWLEDMDQNSKQKVYDDQHTSGKGLETLPKNDIDQHERNEIDRYPPESIDQHHSPDIDRQPPNGIELHPPYIVRALATRAGLASPGELSLVSVELRRRVYRLRPASWTVLRRAKLTCYGHARLAVLASGIACEEGAKSVSFAAKNIFKQRIFKEALFLTFILDDSYANEVPSEVVVSIPKVVMSVRNPRKVSSLAMKPFYRVVPDPRHHCSLHSFEADQPAERSALQHWLGVLIAKLRHQHSHSMDGSLNINKMLVSGNGDNFGDSNDDDVDDTETETQGTFFW